MKRLRKYKFLTEESANQYIGSISQENSAILLNNLPIAQTIETGLNPAFDKNQEVTAENHPLIFSDVDFGDQYLVDVIWQSEINSQWNEFEVFPTNTLWRNRIFNELTDSEKNSAIAEYNLYLNNKRMDQIGAKSVLENDFFILNNYTMACLLNKEGNLLTGESASLDARSSTAIMVYTIHETANVNYNFKLETDNSEDTLKVVILEKENDETPKEVLFETNTTEIKNGVISLKRGNIIACEYIKNHIQKITRLIST